MYKNLNNKNSTTARSILDHGLEELETGLLELASRVEKATNLALLALRERNYFQAQEVICIVTRPDFNQDKG